MQSSAQRRKQPPRKVGPDRRESWTPCQQRFHSALSSGPSLEGGLRMSQLQCLSQVPTEIVIKNFSNGFPSLVSGIYTSHRSLIPMSSLSSLNPTPRPISKLCGLYESSLPTPSLYLCSSKRVRKLETMRDHFPQLSPPTYACPFLLPNLGRSAKTHFSPWPLLIGLTLNINSERMAMVHSTQKYQELYMTLKHQPIYFHSLPKC